jgi:hypothetical protein
MLADIVVSKTRIKLLELFLSDVTSMYHVRDLVRQTHEEINAVRRELARMEEAGMVKKEPRGNRLYYWFRKDYIYFADLVSMVAKSTGLGGAINKNRSKLGNIQIVMISGRFARHEPRKKADEVDVLVVGDISMHELAALVKAEESKREQPINYTPMTMDELRFRRSRRDPFLQSILMGERIIIIGNEEDLVG